MDNSLKIGSDAWTCGDEYSEEYKARNNYVLQTLNRAALHQYLSDLRGGQRCSLSDRFSVGTVNLVIKATFDDGSQWIVRLRMPDIEQFSLVRGETPKCQGSSYPDQLRYEMQSEVDTMNLIRLKTDIPIPQIHGYNYQKDNSVGFPFIVMDYIHGTTAEELSQSIPGDHEGIPFEYQDRFWRQIAMIMVKLANIRFTQAGSIICDDSGNFHIGKFADTGTGPYTSAKEFLNHYPHSIKATTYSAEDGNLGQEALLESLNDLITSLTPPSEMDVKDFGLSNYDLGPHNVIVDRDFNVLSVIDWDAVFAMPDSALYRMPTFMGLVAPYLGVTESNARILKREQLGRDFAKTVEQVSRDADINGDFSFTFTQTGFFSKEAYVYRSLIYLRFKQSFVNKKWTNSLRWLRQS